MTTPLVGQTLDDLTALMKALDEPGFRAKQLYQWLYTRHARSYDEMTNLAKSLRTKLAEQFTISPFTGMFKQQSADGTVKYLFQLADGQQIESVLMYFEERDAYAVCLSTQVGCAVNCDFCATGKIGFKRQLTSGEIVDQLLAVQADSGATVRNIVLMGQGEPLLNYHHTLAAIRLINHGAEIGMRHITLSTSGIVPKINQLADERLQLTLAVSLHAPDDETRLKFMPINQKYPLAELMPALRAYAEKTGRRVTIEYILLAGVNDSHAHAVRLAKLLAPLRCNINLIPYNPIGEQYGYQRPSNTTIVQFRETLKAHSRHTVTVRLERGADIDAACGQLSNKVQLAAV
jgi:23S rRNA (adenine2503-C2)-methyltransferase